MGMSDMMNDLGNEGYSVDKCLQWLGNAERSLPERVWREVGLEDYRFYAGKQDKQEVLEELTNQRRPASVYNEIKPKIDMLAGLAAQSKHEPNFAPTGTEDGALAELLTIAVKYYRNQMKLSRKELDAFTHTIKSGRSLLHFYIDKTNPYEPKICCKRIAGYNFYVDPDFTEYDMSDAKYLFIDKWLDEDEINSLWDVDVHELQSFHTTYGGSISATLPTFFNEFRNKYRIIEGWYYKYCNTIYFVNPITGAVENLPKKDFNAFKNAMLSGMETERGRVQIKTVDELQPADAYMKQYFYRIFSGNKDLEAGKSPYRFNAFPSVFYGAYNDDDDNSWFGAIKMMKDPQKAVNTMRRQLSHLLQTLPKGILVHEAGAILNIEEYEKKSAEPNFHLELASGALGRYKFEQQPQISPVYSQFDATCTQGMKDASGIQNELMGIETSSRTPGVTQRARQETSLAVLYTLFDNYKESRVNGDKILCSLVQQYMTQPKILRIAGAEGQQLIQINTQINPQVQGFNDITVGEYDVAVTETIESPTQRLAMAQLLAEYSQNNPGVVPPDLILEYADAPYSIKERLRQAAASQAQQAQAAREDELLLRLLEIEVKAKDSQMHAEIEAAKIKLLGSKQNQGGNNGTTTGKSA